VKILKKRSAFTRLTVKTSSRTETKKINTMRKMKSFPSFQGLDKLVLREIFSTKKLEARPSRQKLREKVFRDYF